ncbi:hypothetical protein Cst_c20350 [Thermoclostridium stercorarium subsp. stercorarium DSM 8532]|uniref:Uncharacterized protein n=1 Tax=Thermoclostridium stercorarium (strain ATCC 35414 / DSM 8532 / NCIMB 11754) TaxID=1121335 RepID=L7VTU9_THES1|nr:hypothetical protein Cst_c20350 [Thermoclostridium stercorarium subsp. stercorarium DSM 8532]AGI39987.1 hypothetical protein Clst_1948 [Thermoclostridium stercorarium subsp. stercorarium DSM 8532]
MNYTTVFLFLYRYGAGGSGVLDFGHWSRGMGVKYNICRKNTIKKNKC